MTGQLDHGGDEGRWAWGVEWVWVGGYSAASTTIILLNFSLFIAVIRNRYLHYSFNYVVFALALRNICRVVFTLYLVFIAKLSQSKYPNELVTQLLPGPTDFSRYGSVPLLCDITSLVDQVLTTTTMFYLAILSLYLFCRQPNPPNIPANLRTLKLYGLQCGIVPIQESWWLAPLLLLVPVLLSLGLGAPALLLHLSHPMSAIPGGELCLAEAGDTETQLRTFLTSVAILGYCLPLALIVCLVIGLSVRRCVSCYSTTCVSSFCKEELLLSLLTLPTAAAHLLLYIPVLDANLVMVGFPATGLATIITPTLARLIEMLTAGALPLLAFILLPAFSNWSSRPDTDDIRTGYRRSRRDQSTNAPDSRRDSLASFGFD